MDVLPLEGDQERLLRWAPDGHWVGAFRSSTVTLLTPDGQQVAEQNTTAAVSGMGDDPGPNVSDVATTWTISVPAARFVAWSPDSRHYLFRPNDPDSLFVGHLCAEPMQVQGSPDSDADGPAAWVDDDRFVFLDTDEEEEHGAWRLRLGRLDGTSTELASFVTSQERPRLATNR